MSAGVDDDTNDPVENSEVDNRELRDLIEARMIKASFRSHLKTLLIDI